MGVGVGKLGRRVFERDFHIIGDAGNVIKCLKDSWVRFIEISHSGNLKNSLSTYHDLTFIFSSELLE